MIIGIIWLARDTPSAYPSRKWKQLPREKGELTLHGVMRPIEFDVTTTTGKDLKGKVTHSQKDFDIKPYKALLGTLKVKNEVDISRDLTLRWVVVNHKFV